MRLLDRDDKFRAALFTNDEIWFEIYITEETLWWRSTDQIAAVNFNAHLYIGWKIMDLDESSESVKDPELMFEFIIKHPDEWWIAQRL